MPVLCCRDPLATGKTQPTLLKSGAHRQLPLGASDYTTCMALPLSNGAARCSHANSHLKCFRLCLFFFGLITASCLSDRISFPAGFSAAAPSKEITGPLKANGAPTNMGVFMLGERVFILGPNKLNEYTPGCVASSP